MTFSRSFTKENYAMHIYLTNFSFVVHNIMQLLLYENLNKGVSERAWVVEYIENGMNECGG